MSKLYFKYGTMGSSKTANALMTRFNYKEQGYNVLLIKPSIDNRFENGESQVISRVGLSAECTKFTPNEDLYNLYKTLDSVRKIDVIIVDECQFLSKKQVEELKQITRDIPVLCYGLKTNFKTELFEGSKRLLELADSIEEIKSVCKCGAKATINARIVNGKVTTSGAEIQIGAEESYQSMCYWCFQKRLLSDNVRETDKTNNLDKSKNYRYLKERE